MSQNNSNNQNGIWRVVLSWKTIIIIILLGIALYTLTPKLIGATEAFKLLAQTKIYFIFLALLVEACSYAGAGWMMVIVMRVLKYRLKFFNTIRISVLNAFAIHVFPVGGLGETAVNFYFLSRMGVTSGKTLLMFVIKNIFWWTSFGFFFLIGLALAPTHGQLSSKQQIIIFVLLILVFLFLWYLVYLYNHKDKMHARAQFFGKIAGWVLPKIFKRKPISLARVNVIVDDIYEGMTLFSRDKRSIMPAFGSGLIYWAGDIFCLALVFLSFGYTPHLGVLILGYCLAILISMISLIPGGIGIMEGSLSLLYISLGVPGSVALVSVLVFRLLSFWIPFLIGIWAFASLKKDTNNHLKPNFKAV